MKLDKGGGYQNGKPTSITCGNRQYGEFLKGTGSCFGCGKEGHKVRYYPNIDSTGSKGKKDAPNVPMEDVQRQRLVSVHSGKEDPSRMRMMMIMLVSNNFFF